MRTCDLGDVERYADKPGANWVGCRRAATHQLVCGTCCCFQHTKEVQEAGGKVEREL